MPAKIVGTVSLTPELTALIEAKVATGLYGSASEVVRAGLRLLVEQDRQEEQTAKKVTEGRRNAR
ncbi:type II toxin-antitoxin system ParD family antitoxin [Salinarimonas soli]|uniref:Type II toxin-antitoxin system ParD family antitoxin n=1 Tax=Salinarimonas soli TaxID=1638099 RepID=A0A5B2VA12_9HYPH|nr:type II toxin-antitoxin system ParD family antitoxin [Salinarimonas soli]KAA2235568.1 type II toxin-antitoxin system ParD family antitoxin [Salinarimonas soli]